MRIESKYPLPNGGYLHPNGSSNGKAVPHNGSSRMPKIINFQWLTDTYCKAATDAMVVKLAKELGVSFDSLRALNIGWDGLAYTQPMQLPIGKIVGIQRRFPDGSKLCVDGSKSGFFAPSDLNGEAPLFVCEGYSDLAALLTIGLVGVGLFNVG